MSPDARTLTAADYKRLKVLLVDPNTYLRGVIADSLRRLQIVNLAMANGAVEAYALGHTFKPDLIFVDWDAGRLSGLEFTREVRRNTSGLARETPIVLMATEIDHDQLMSARQAGINEFLLKPVSAQGILSRIEEILLRPRRFIVSRNYVGPCRRRKEDPAFAGPWRRLMDVPPERKKPRVSEENLARLRVILDKLSLLLVEVSDRHAAIRGIYRMLAQHVDEIRAFGDEVILKVWDTALSYVEGVGITDSFDTGVIRYHVQTIQRIIDMPEEAILHRNAVATELQRLVAKKIQAASEQAEQSSAGMAY